MDREVVDYLLYPAFFGIGRNRQRNFPVERNDELRDVRGLLFDLIRTANPRWEDLAGTLPSIVT